MNHKKIVPAVVLVVVAVAVVAGGLLAGSGGVAEPQTTAPDPHARSPHISQTPHLRQPPHARTLAPNDSRTGRPSNLLAAAPQSVLRIYPCAPGAADAVAARLQNEFGRGPNVRIVPDARTSQVFVMAPLDVQAQIASRAAPQADPPAQADVTAIRNLPPRPTAQTVLPTRIREVQLWHATGQELETSLLRLLGNRLSPIAGPEPGASAYRLALPNGQVLRLSVNRRSNRVLVEGMGAALESFVQLAHALDTREQPADRTVSVVSLGASRPADIRKTVQAIQAAGDARPVTPTSGAIPRRQGTPQVAMAWQQPEAAPGPPQPAEPGQKAAPPAEGQLAGEPQEGGLIGPVQIEILEGLGQILIRGHERDVRRVIELIQEIEEISGVTEPEIKVLPLRHVHCTSLASLLTQIYEEVYSLRQGSVSITALVKPNALLLIGQEENVKTVVGLAQRLDQPDAPETLFRVFRLKHTPVEDARATLEEAFPEPEDDEAGLAPRVLITHDFRSNTLIVRASPRDMAEIARMIDEFDSEDIGASNEIRIIPLNNSLADELAPILQDAITGQIYGPQAALRTGIGQIGQRQNYEPKSIRLQFLTVDSEGQRLLKSGILADAQITSHPTLNALIVTASAESMPLIVALVRELDRLPVAEAQIKVFTVVNGDAQTLITMLETIFAEQTVAGQPAVRTAGADEESTLVPMRFAADVRTNSIIAIGSAGDLNVVESVLVRLDDSLLRKRKTVVYALKNSFATDVAAAVSEFLSTELEAQQPVDGLLSSVEQVERDVVIVAEEVSNKLIISATEKFFDQVLELVEQLDEREPMVMIQVLIAEVALRDEEEFGVELGLQDPIFFNRSINGIPGFLFNSTGDLGNNTNVPFSDRVGSQGISNLGLGRFNPELGFGGMVLSASSEFVNVTIRALALEGRVQILGRPQIMALDNREAYVSVGQEVPLVTDTRFGEIGTSQVTSWNYEPVGLGLTVTPQISPDGQVVMIVVAEKKSLSDEGISISGTDQPIINSIVAETVVSAMDGQTVVLGGLITEDKNTVTRKVPGLGDLRFLGPLFRYDSVEERRAELLIILTPRIVKSEEDARMIMQMEAARMNWCLEDVLELHDGAGILGAEEPWSDSETPVIYPDGKPDAEQTPTPAGPSGDAVPTSAPQAIPVPDTSPFRLKPPGSDSGVQDATRSTDSVEPAAYQRLMASASQHPPQRPPATSLFGPRAEPPRSGEPALITTRETVFSIPFQIDGVGQAPQDPREVQLYVSSNRGADWRLYDRVDSQAERFLFVAVDDGEYWFAIRTVDQSGRLRPPGLGKPELRVVVDTTPPQIHLQAERNQPGTITVRWRADDPHLNTESLRIECRSAAGGGWRELAVDRRNIQAHGLTRTGELTWRPEPGARFMEIRGRILDTAGNSAVGHARINVDLARNTTQWPRG